MLNGQVLEIEPVGPVSRATTVPSTVMETPVAVRSHRMVCHSPSFRLAARRDAPRAVDAAEQAGGHACGVLHLEVAARRAGLPLLDDVAEAAGRPHPDGEGEVRGARVQSGVVGHVVDVLGARRGHVGGDVREAVPGRAGVGRAGGHLVADGAVEPVAAAVDHHRGTGGLVELVQRDRLGRVGTRGGVPSECEQPECCDEQNDSSCRHVMSPCASRGGRVAADRPTTGAARLAVEGTSGDAPENRWSRTPPSTGRNVDGGDFRP